ncbi:MAG: CotY/CotZ family spore coat protein [Bacilli bacterium]
MCGENRPTTNTKCSCLDAILEVILKLQRRGHKIDEKLEGCDKPFLGPCPNVTCYNTRPVTFFRCCDGGQWTMPYNLGDTTGTSGVFRVENLDGCCCGCRILAANPDVDDNPALPYVATDCFFTINLECIGALKCLPDTYISCL